MTMSISVRAISDRCAAPRRLRLPMAPEYRPRSATTMPARLLFASRS